MSAARHDGGLSVRPPPVVTDAGGHLTVRVGTLPPGDRGDSTGSGCTRTAYDRSHHRGPDHQPAARADRPGGLDQRRAGGDDVVHQDHGEPSERPLHAQRAGQVRPAGGRVEPGLVGDGPGRDEQAGDPPLSAATGGPGEPQRVVVAAGADRRPRRRHRDEHGVARSERLDRTGQQPAERPSQGEPSALLVPDQQRPDHLVVRRGGDQARQPGRARRRRRRRGPEPGQVRAATRAERRSRRVATGAVHR